MREFSDNALGDFIPGWDKMSETEKLNKMSDIILCMQWQKKMVCIWMN